MAHCSWINCRREYDRMGQRAEGLLPEVGNRQFFCSDACRKAFALRCDGSALRRAAWEQDEGVCRGCDLDTSALVEAIRHMTPLERRRALVEKGFVPKPGFTEARLKKLSAQTEWHSGLGCNLWEADHRLRVANGGGECDEDNIDTLCLVCHGAKSVEENRVARAKKKAAAAAAAAAGGGATLRLRRRTRGRWWSVRSTAPTRRRRRRCARCCSASATASRPSPIASSARRPATACTAAAAARRRMVAG